MSDSNWVEAGWEYNCWDINETIILTFHNVCFSSGEYVILNEIKKNHPVCEPVLTFMTPLAEIREKTKKI